MKNNNQTKHRNSEKKNIVTQATERLAQQTMYVRPLGIIQFALRTKQQLMLSDRKN